MEKKKHSFIDPCQRGYFLPVPNEIIRYIKYFTGNEIKLLIYMLSTRNTWDKPYGLSREIAAHCGFSKNTVTKLTASLAEKGLLAFQHTAKGKVFRLNILAKGTRHTEVLSHIEENLSREKKIRFPGIRYLHSDRKEKTSDFTYSTKFEDLFSGGYRKRDIRTEEDRKLGEREFDPFKCSFFHEMTGNEIKLLLFIKYRSAITATGKARLNHRDLSEALAVSHKLVASAMKRLTEHFQSVRTENAGDRQHYWINYEEIEIPKRSSKYQPFSQKGVHPYIVQDISTVQNILRDSRFSFSDSEKKELSAVQKDNPSQKVNFWENIQKIITYAEKLQKDSSQAKSSRPDGKVKFSPAFETEAARLEKEKMQRLNPSYVPEEARTEPEELKHIFIQKDESTEKLFAELEKLQKDRERYIRQAEEKQTKDAPMAETIRIFVKNGIDGKIKEVLDRLKDRSAVSLSSEQTVIISEVEKMIQNGFSKAA